ncbi:MAG TPA: TIGR04282 family arsenosugar biosynthesis glycosyltransferase [Gemmatimonadaceae bacterium]|nr:TIGR04282 family arsenosugar biosynthesis glycosyltransferase [Gemmatimonadaceae bacterium]
MIASSRSLVIFASAPEKGRVKSRIAADLGPDVALTAYKTLAEHAVAAASHVDWCRKTIAYAPNGTGDAMRSWFGDLFDYRAQGDGDLGRRMVAALERAFAEGADRVILIGVDCPGVTDAIITEAFTRLDSADAVLGPSFDGGYYLIGMKKPLKELFNDIPFGSGDALQKTLTAARRASLRVSLLDWKRDVNTGDAWKGVAKMLTDKKPVFKSAFGF